MFVEGRRIKKLKVRCCLIFTTKTLKWSAKLKKKVLISKANNINVDFDTKWKYPDTSGAVPSRGGGGQLGQRLQVRRESARPRLRGRACGPSRHFSVVWMMKYRWSIQRSGSVCVHVLHRGLELNCTTFLCCLNGHIKMINTEIPVWITEIIWRGAQASYACMWSIGFSMWV